MNCVFSKGISILCFPIRHEVFRNSVFISNFRLITYPVVKVYGNAVSFCSSTESNFEDLFPKPVRKEELRKKYERPVDWLPFEWHRRPRYNPFEKSGDFVTELEYDPAWPKPDFELSDELKTASDDVKHNFSLATASKAEIKEAIRRNILKRVQRHPNDYTSLEVEIALRTVQIRSSFEHSRFHRRDKVGGRSILYQLINKRNSRLRQLYTIDRERYNWLAKELKVEYTPGVRGSFLEKYCKKWHLRVLVKEYCKIMIKNKKKAYQEELKQQQADFLKEKEETLAWIEKEEKELANLTI